MLSFLGTDCSFPTMYKAMYSRKGEMKKKLLMEAKLILNIVPTEYLGDIYSHLEIHKTDPKRLLRVANLFISKRLCESDNVSSDPGNELSNSSQSSDKTSQEVLSQSPVCNVIDNEKNNETEVCPLSTNKDSSVSINFPRTLPEILGEEDVLVQRKKCYDILLKTFPDAQRSFLRQLCSQRKSWADWLNDTVSYMLQNGYPTRKAMGKVRFIRKNHSTGELEDVTLMQNELTECSHCLYNAPACDIVTCGGGHMFCKDCVRIYAQERINNGETSFPCPNTCDSEFSTANLRAVLHQKSQSLSSQSQQDKMAFYKEIEADPFCAGAYFSENDKKYRPCNYERRSKRCRCWKPPSSNLDYKTTVALEDNLPDYEGSSSNIYPCECGTLVCHICRLPVFPNCYYFDKINHHSHISSDTDVIEGSDDSMLQHHNAAMACRKKPLFWRRNHAFVADIYSFI